MMTQNDLTQFYGQPCGYMNAEIKIAHESERDQRGWGTQE